MSRFPYLDTDRNETIDVEAIRQPRQTTADDGFVTRDQARAFRPVPARTLLVSTTSGARGGPCPLSQLAVTTPARG